MMLTLCNFFVDSRPWERGLEHSGRAYIPIAAPSLNVRISTFLAHLSSAEICIYAPSKSMPLGTRPSAQRKYPSLSGPSVGERAGAHSQIYQGSSRESRW